ncbi:EAL domain-containing protein [Neptuniibacter caesariensis]|uniref:cyclic-guanylate-specific phosphodiesterase n=1 Tax=Neptuniibacter caesariensis TaxID=207954 RepID=A0A7U8GQ82_NEPCE|nr:EAL domain-containing protein [Neptuniibacter caesariensis]EAR60057.1 PAS:GGDEF protein [Neptuniibacter caesariensis]
MSGDILLPLVNNVALLLAMGVLFDAFAFNEAKPSLPKRITSGLILGCIAIAIMSMPLSITSGVIIDTRSILLSVSGLFFGVIPTVIAASMAAVFRIMEGGQGTIAGLLIIMTSAGIGIYCYQWKQRLGHEVIKGYQLYLMGLTVHVSMMVCLLVLPYSTLGLLLSEITLPIIVIFPLATVLLGGLLSQQISRKKAEAALRESERTSNHARHRLEATFSAIPDLLFEMDIEGRYLACHASDPDDLVAKPEELIGKSVFDFIPLDEAQIIVEAIREADLKGISKGRQVTLQVGRGLREFELSVSRKHDDESSEHHFIVLSRDITERKRHERELHIAATAFDSQEGMLITDAEHRILRVNNAFTRVTGYEAEEAIGNTPAFLQSGKHSEDFYQTMMESLSKNNYWQGEVWNQRKSGEIYPQHLTITAVQTSAGEITNYVGAFTDITQRKQDEADIHQLAFYDSLTGLPNRRSLQERLDSALSSCRHTRQLGAVFFIDLDNFKNLNDTAGHDQGDKLLVEVANRLNSCVRNADMVARLGGDEFIVILENLGVDESNVLAQVKDIVAKVILTIQAPLTIGTQAYHPTCSIGIALFSEKDFSDEVMKRSDMAMYQAKSSGKNTYRFFDPVAEEALCSLARMDADLRFALSNQQLELHYQPQYRCQTLIGAEALLRWKHPDRGMVSPAEFIPLAEDTGLILPIGEWVIRQACKQLQQWQERPETAELFIAVNVSARQFCQDNFVESVRQLLNTYGVSAEKLKLELTESLVLMDVEDTIQKMQALRSYGIRFALDDFGTGYSSLSHLKRLPLDQIKIDRSFIRDVPEDQDDSEIVQAIIAMGQNLGLNVLAEGVETDEQLAFLTELDCLDIQGFLLGRPSSIDKFETTYIPANMSRLGMA